MTTIAGDGNQGNDKEGGKIGIDQKLSSPWDLELGKSPNALEPDLLYIAMAGLHQIWVHFLQDAAWTKERLVLRVYSKSLYYRQCIIINDQYTDTVKLVLAFVFQAQGMRPIRTTHIPTKQLLLNHQD